MQIFISKRVYFMKNVSIILFFLLGLSACSTSPTGRSQLSLLPDSELNKMGVQSFEKIKKEIPATKNKKIKAYVLCVARSIIPQVKQQPDPKKWEVQVFASDEANAFALPGNKIGVYEGLLKYAVNQHQLAAVIGHELGHVIAHHGNERVSHQLATQAGVGILAAVVGGTQKGNWAVTAAALGAQYGVVLPFSRKHESEADMIGVELMAKSGFKPSESVQLWKNMAKAGSGGPEILSTHPSNETRIEDLTKSLKKATPIYQKAYKSGKRPRCSL
ncbi:MAG: M48 family peptidase [Gammaproteobacteria bacterium]|nr:MAG: M48 family peptidase [Gammaproteobacteria bacterium]